MQSAGSMTSENPATGQKGQIFTRVAKHDGTLVAVREVDKPAINVTKPLLYELNMVSRDSSGKHKDVLISV